MQTRTLKENHRHIQGVIRYFRRNSRSLDFAREDRACAGLLDTSLRSRTDECVRRHTDLFLAQGSGRVDAGDA